jgi:hypothetical protein
VAWLVFESDYRRSTRRRGLQRLLAHTLVYPWAEPGSSEGMPNGLNESGRPVRDLAEGEGRRAAPTRGLEVLFCLRVIQPDVVAFRSK